MSRVNGRLRAQKKRRNTTDQAWVELAEHRADRTIFMDAPNRCTEHVGDRQHVQLGEGLIGCDWDAVGDHNLFEQSFYGQALDRWWREDGMGGTSNDASRPLLSQ